MLDASKDSTWSVDESADLYNIVQWGRGYFSVQPTGNVHVHPTRDPNLSCDLKQLVDRLRDQGIDLPILLRFDGILKDRLEEIHGAFTKTIKEYDYQGTYSCVYPIKVNQQRQVVQQIVSHGEPLGFGLEAGSKPELLAVLAMTGPDAPVICNGFKDGEYVEMALLAQKMGRLVIPVVEKYTELELILNYAERLQVRPKLGMRAKLASRGSGRWSASGGSRSKFGLTAAELLRGTEVLRDRQMADCLCLLHFHLGSQITNIRHFKTALMEAARIYVELSQHGAGLKYLDVGGGLGVDYIGAQANTEASMNYTLQEYSHDVVHVVQSVCDASNVAHPHLISESGRAIAAYHSVLVFSVLGVSGPATGEPPSIIGDHSVQPLSELQQTYRELSSENAHESYHDAQQSLETLLGLFSTGHVSLQQRAAGENLYWAICRQVRKLISKLKYVPEEIRALNSQLCDTYFCNFSLFQSLPDSWAIDHVFPIMPIHRLQYQPTRRARLGDITCDSDGKVDCFVERHGQERTLRLHAFDGSPYYLATFLVGAYQEILGDLHNLFGDTNAVHVQLSDSGEVQLDSIVKGETVSEVLDYVQFDQRDLLHRLQAAVETAVREGRINHQEAGRCLSFYDRALNGYTYLLDER